MGEERVLLDAQLIALALHDIDGIVEYAFDEEVT